MLEQDGRASNLERNGLLRVYLIKNTSFEKFLCCSGIEHFCFLLLEVLDDKSSWDMDFLPTSLLEVRCELVTFTYSQSTFDHKNQKFGSEGQNTA